jgi:hypothetical protein
MIWVAELCVGRAQRSCVTPRLSATKNDLRVTIHGRTNSSVLQLLLSEHSKTCSYFRGGDKRRRGLNRVAAILKPRTLHFSASKIAYYPSVNGAAANGMLVSIGRPPKAMALPIGRCLWPATASIQIGAFCGGMCQMLRRHPRTGYPGARPVHPKIQ